MQHDLRLIGLLSAQPRPAHISGFARRHTAGAGGHSMQDGAVQRLVDDFVVVGHVPPSLNTTSLSQSTVRVTFEQRGHFERTVHD